MLKWADGHLCHLAWIYVVLMAHEIFFMCENHEQPPFLQTQSLVFVHQGYQTYGAYI